MRRKNFLKLMAIMMAAVMCAGFVACGSDDDEDDIKPGTEEPNGDGNKETSEQEKIVVTVDASGNVKGDHRFSAIDDSNFMIDDIKYTAKSGDLWVTGYDEAYFKGEARLIDALEYQGRCIEVKGIEKEAFKECKVLTAIHIPSSITRIGEDAFYDCTSLTAVHITEIEQWFQITFNDNPLKFAHHLYLKGKEVNDFVIPESITSIGDRVFWGYSGLTSITIPKSVTTIGNYSFYYCTSLTSVSIPNSVTSIGAGAFFGCSGLTSVSIPESVTSIGRSAFDYCSGLTKVEFVSIESICSIKFESAFSNPLSHIQHLFIDGNEVTDLVIPSSVKTIGDYAFYRCTGLTSVSIPESVTSIGAGAFFGCSGLTSVSIPNSVTSIGDSAFEGCTGLTSVSLPNSVTNIGAGAFKECSGLTSVSIPNSLAKIGISVFENCSGLNTISIPESVTSIGRSAFDGCSNLKDLYCYAVRPPFYDDPYFLGVPLSAILHVPAESIEDYKYRSPWKSFRYIVAIE